MFKYTKYINFDIRFEILVYDLPIVGNTFEVDPMLLSRCCNAFGHVLGKISGKGKTFFYFAGVFSRCLNFQSCYNFNNLILNILLITIYVFCYNLKKLLYFLK